MGRRFSQRFAWAPLCCSLLAASGPASAATGGLAPAAFAQTSAPFTASERSPGVPIDVLSVSCPSKGNCTAAGWDTGLVETSYAISERNGRWGQARQLAPHISQINIRQVACPAAGDCAGGGSAGNQAFVIDEVHGVWHGMQLVALNLDKRHGAEVASVSCGSPGNCVAGGTYRAPSAIAAFLITERNFRWGRAFGVPGLPASRFTSSVLSVSCTSAGNCAAGGQIYNPPGSSASGAFMIIERNGRWGRAFQVAGNLGGSDPAVHSVSCVAAGDCAAGGISGTEGGISDGQAFLVTERNGRRGQAVAVTGVSDARDITVSCRSLGSCSAGGSDGRDNATAAFLVDEAGGRWGSVMQVPGLSALDTGHDSAITLACASPGNCAGGGFYNTDIAFVVSETNGQWGTALPVPGLSSSSVNIVTDVACAPARYYCVAGGTGFLITDVNGQWGQPVPAVTP